MECIVDKEQCRQRQVTNVVVATEQDSNTKYKIKKKKNVGERYRKDRKRHIKRKERQTDVRIR